MIDNIKITQKLHNIPDVFISEDVFPPRIVYNGLTLYLSNNRYYQGFIKGVRFKLTEREFEIQNSLWKFFHHPETSPYFTRSEIKKCLLDIQSIIGKKVFEDLVINRIEIALNIHYDYRKLSLLDLVHGSGIEKVAMYHRSSRNRYGLKFVYEEYELKIYDKNKQSQIKDGLKVNNSNLTRIELVIKKKRKLIKSGLSVSSLYELYSKEFLDSAFKYLWRTFDQVSCNNQITLSGLLPKQICLIAGIENQRAKSYLKKNHKDSYKKLSSQYRMIKKAHSIPFEDQKQDILTELQKSFEYVMRN